MLRLVQYHIVRAGEGRLSVVRSTPELERFFVTWSIGRMETLLSTTRPSQESSQKHLENTRVAGGNLLNHHLLRTASSSGDNMTAADVYQHGYCMAPVRINPRLGKSEIHE